MQPVTRSLMRAGSPPWQCPAPRTFPCAPEDRLNGSSCGTRLTGGGRLPRCLAPQLGSSSERVITNAQVGMAGMQPAGQVRRAWPVRSDGCDARHASKVTAGRRAARMPACLQQPRARLTWLHRGAALTGGRPGAPAPAGAGAPGPHKRRSWVLLRLLHAAAWEASRTVCTSCTGCPPR